MIDTAAVTVHSYGEPPLAHRRHIWTDTHDGTLYQLFVHHQEPTTIHVAIPDVEAEHGYVWYAVELLGALEAIVKAHQTDKLLENQADVRATLSVVTVRGEESEERIGGSDEEE